MPSRKHESPLAPIGRLEQLFTVPCAVPLQVWVAAAVPAALEAFATLIKPSWKQTVKQVAGSSWLHQLKVVAEDADRELPTLANNGLQFLFELAEYVDQASWYLFLADLGGEFLANWTSNIMEFSNCKPGELDKTLPGYLPSGGFTVDQGWTVGPEWTIIKGGTSFAHASSLTVPPRSTWSMAASCQLGVFVGAPTSYGNRIVNVTTGEVYQTNIVNEADQILGRTPVVMKLNGATGDSPETIEFQVIWNNAPGAVEGIANGGRFTAYVNTPD